MVAPAGNRTAANAAARSSVSLLSPIRSPGDYNLIIDGSARGDTGSGEPRLRITPTKAVLRRPAPAPKPGAACADDCVPMFPK